LDPDNFDPNSFLDTLIAECQALERPIDLLVFPECTLTGFYPDRAQDLAKNRARTFASVFGTLASTLHTQILAGAFRQADGGVANEAVFYSSSGEEMSSYRKSKLFSPAREDEFVLAGEKSVLESIAPFLVSPKICYDLRFPACFFDQSPEVDLFAVIANWPDKRKKQWEALLQARAIENECFVLGVNRFGMDLYGNDYTGRPLLFDPTGGLCTPSSESEIMTVWSVPARSSYEVVGSTVDKLAS